MNRVFLARELVRLARELMAFDFPTELALKRYLEEHPDADRSNHRVVRGLMQRTDPGVEIRGHISTTLKGKLGLRGNSARANPVFSQLMTFQDFRQDGEGQDSNKFHYFAIYKDQDTGEFVGGNAWGRIGYPNTVKAIEVARGSDQGQVERKLKAKMGDKSAKGYKEQRFMQ